MDNSAGKWGGGGGRGRGRPATNGIRQARAGLSCCRRRWERLSSLHRSKPGFSHQELSHLSRLTVMARSQKKGSFDDGARSESLYVLVQNGSTTDST